MFTVEEGFPREGDAIASWVKALRPQQWAKNILVFLPMLVGKGWFDFSAWAHAWIAFAALCCAASSVYLINDAADIDADRRHPRKRTRPLRQRRALAFAGIAVAVVLLASAIALAIQADVLPLLALYLIAATLYTFWLKRVVWWMCSCWPRFTPSAWCSAAWRLALRPHRGSWRFRASSS